MELNALPNTPLRFGRKLLESQFVESLVSPNPIERYVDLVDPLWSRRDVKANVQSVEWQTPRSATLTLKPNGNWQGFEAGQHIGVTVEIDGILTTRFYSPSGSAAGDLKTIELTISAHPQGKVSNYLVDRAKPGMVVGLSPAEGDFVLPASRPRRTLLISGGSGITPVMSMLRTLCDEGHGDPVTFLHYARSPEDAIYDRELEAIADEFPNVSVSRGFTREFGAAPSLQGHLSRKQLKVICPDYAGAATFVCGPTALVESVEAIWKADGLTSQLSTEHFVLPEPVVVAQDATGTITCTGSGKQIANDGRPLLVQAEESGLTPRSGCRMGICHTCICHMEQGSIRNVRTGEVKTVSNEMVQICTNAPVGDVIINL